MVKYSVFWLSCKIWKLCLSPFTVRLLIRLQERKTSLHSTQHKLSINY